MLGAAVGINMTFLYPYSLLAKGWGNEHKTLSRWDLGLSMFLPFALVTSLIMIGMTVTGIYDGSDTVNTTITPIAAAQSLSGILGDKLGRLVFCCGLIGMSCTAISTHMVVCGFTMCEMLGLEYTKTRFRLFALTPSIGIFGVVFTLPLWFPVAASAICLTMLPIAYLIFLILNNKKSYIGDAVGKGFSRVFFNTILIVALIVASVGAFIKVKTSVYDVLRSRLFPAETKTSAFMDAEPRDGTLTSVTSTPSNQEIQP
jgi:succinate dehydrogenase hydrophobic anchor subunit